MGLASKIKNSEGSSASATPPQNTQYSTTPSAPPYYAAPAAAATAPEPYGQQKQQPQQQHHHHQPQPYGQQQPYYGSSYPSPSPYPQGQSNSSPPVRDQPYSQAYAYPASSAYGQPYPSQSHGEKPQSAPSAYGQPYPSQSHGEKPQSAPPTSYPVSAYAPPSSHGAGYKDGAPPSYGQSSYGQSIPHQPPPSTLQPYGGPVVSNNARDVMAQKLQSIIQNNGLQCFYDRAKFEGVLQKVSSINFGEIAAQWRIGKELAYDLAPLALYDIIFYCDDSGSMAFEENGERINDLKFILSKVSGVATLFDDDGIVVRFMNSNVNGDGVRSAADVANLISQVRFSGATPLGTNFDRKVVQPFVLGQTTGNARMAKPVLAIIITDGEPYGEARDTIVQVIRRVKDALARTPYGSGALAVQIAQVGKDAKTQKFLEALDKDPMVGGMIDCTSYYEMEEEEFARKGVTLTPELWLLKMCVGAIDPEYDSKDD